MLTPVRLRVTFRLQDTLRGTMTVDGVKLGWSRNLMLRLFGPAASTKKLLLIPVYFTLLFFPFLKTANKKLLYSLKKQRLEVSKIKFPAHEKHKKNKIIQTLEIVNNSEILNFFKN